MDSLTWIKSMFIWYLNICGYFVLTFNPTQVMQHMRLATKRYMLFNIFILKLQNIVSKIGLKVIDTYKIKRKGFLNTIQTPTTSPFY